MADAERAEFDDALLNGLVSLGVTLDAGQRGRLWEHRRLVVDANRQFNLTRITGCRDFAIKHHADGLAPLRWCQRCGIHVSRVLDVGTGAGVPAVPLAVAEAGWRVTALDGTGKKARFVGEVGRALGLANLSAVHGRAESWRGEHRVDLVVFKAVGALARCLEFARPHLVRGGRAVVFKASAVPSAEVSAAETAAARLGFGAAERFVYTLRDGDTTLSRVLWIFRQVGDKPSGRSRGARRGRGGRRGR